MIFELADDMPLEFCESFGTPELSMDKQALINFIGSASQPIKPQIPTYFPVLIERIAYPDVRFAISADITPDEIHTAVADFMEQHNSSKPEKIHYFDIKPEDGAINLYVDFGSADPQAVDGLLLHISEHIGGINQIRIK